MGFSKKKIAFFAASALLFLLVCSTADAVPNLQIYIPGATYDTASETWIINALEYDLWVVGANVEIFDVKFAAAVPTDEDGSIQVTWQQGSMNDPDKSPYLMETLDETNSTNVTGVSFVENGTPVMGDGSELPRHGVFPTDFYEYLIGDFGLSNDPEVMNYVDGDGSSAWGEVKKFHMEVSGYSWVDFVAYDHYVKTNGSAKSHYVFTPFSHDGGGGGVPVPEPATMLLFGTGLIGLASIGKKGGGSSRSE